jgi:hypothetical protein
LGVDHSGLSPRVQQKAVHAGVNSVSYEQASRDLAGLADLNVAPKPIERLVRNWSFAFFPSARHTGPQIALLAIKTPGATRGHRGKRIMS